MNITFGPPPEDWRPDLLDKPSLRTWLYYANGPAIFPAEALVLLQKQLPKEAVRETMAAPDRNRWPRSYWIQPTVYALYIDNETPPPSRTTENAVREAHSAATAAERKRWRARCSELLTSLLGKGGKSRGRALLYQWLEE